eukprot:TRINITY_DN2383_c0_g1_i4.p1 TRINITY_DN2383_c0_g1~~TRINITY_DN2383_c0_g1_i4.p1  ORF type:complete len:918 (+),score=217.93 TRINITY_DN2383_c0_g1_i4:271-2754(+)
MESLLHDAEGLSLSSSPPASMAPETIQVFKDSKKQEEARLNLLIEMGFPQDLCEEALIKHGASMERAVAWLSEKSSLRMKTTTSSGATILVPSSSEQTQKGANQFPNLFGGLNSSGGMSLASASSSDPMDPFRRSGGCSILLRTGDMKSSGGFLTLSGGRPTLTEEEKDTDISTTFSSNEELYFLDEHVNMRDMFEVISREELTRDVENVVQSIAEMLSATHGHSQLILQEFKWNVRELQERFFENSDLYLSKAGVVKGDTPKGTIVCGVCGDTFEEGEWYSLSCGHAFCKDCWRGYLSTHSKDETCNKVNCMHSKCSQIVDSDSFKILADSESINRYFYFLTKSYVETNNKQYAFCPNPSCGLPVKFLGKGKPTAVVQCYCGKLFCFGCSREQHNPASCPELAKWIELASDDEDATMKRIKATSKPCFHCKVMTERNQGCNHMTCKKCGGQWCWMCRGDWKTHGSSTGGVYQCNLYDASDAKKIDMEALEAMAKTDSFLEAYNKYYNHERAAKELSESREKLLSEAFDFSGKNFRSIDFLAESIDYAIKARKLLGYSLIFSFNHLHELNAIQQELFTIYFQNAQHSIELLCDAITKPISDLEKTRSKCNNCTLSVKRALGNLAVAVEEGITFTETDGDVKRKIVPISKGRKFTFTGHFDKKGLIYWLGTMGGTRTFANPSTMGIGVTATRLTNNTGQATDVLGYAAVGQWGENRDGNWWQVDLGSYAVLPTHYSLWTHQGAGLLRNWVLEGSKDGSKYTILREHVNDGGLAETSSKFSWPITPGTDFYRFLRIRMTGKSSQNDYYLTLSAFEVYGDIQQDTVLKLL